MSDQGISAVHEGASSTSGMAHYAGINTVLRDICVAAVQEGEPNTRQSDYNRMAEGLATDERPRTEVIDGIYAATAEEMSARYEFYERAQKLVLQMQCLATNRELELAEGDVLERAVAKEEEVKKENENEKEKTKEEILEDEAMMLLDCTRDLNEKLYSDFKYMIKDYSNERIIEIAEMAQEIAENSDWEPSTICFLSDFLRAHGVPSAFDKLDEPLKKKQKISPPPPTFEVSKKTEELEAKLAELKEAKQAVREEMNDEFTRARLLVQNWRKEMNDAAVITNKHIIDAFLLLKDIGFNSPHSHRVHCWLKHEAPQEAYYGPEDCYDEFIPILFATGLQQILGRIKISLTDGRPRLVRIRPTTTTSIQ